MQRRQGIGSALSQRLGRPGEKHRRAVYTGKTRRSNNGTDRGDRRLYRCRAGDGWTPFHHQRAVVRWPCTYLATSSLHTRGDNSRAFDISIHVRSPSRRRSAVGLPFTRMKSDSPSRPAVIRSLPPDQHSYRCCSLTCKSPISTAIRCTGSMEMSNARVVTRVWRRL